MRKSGRTRVSLLSRSTPRAPASSAARRPALFPPAYPRFSGSSRIGWSGKRARIIATEPSREPLSTTRIDAPPSDARARLSRHPTVSSPWFQLRTTIVTSSAVNGASSEPEPLERQGAVEDSVPQPAHALDHLRGAALAMDATYVGGERAQYACEGAERLPSAASRRRGAGHPVAVQAEGAPVREGADLEVVLVVDDHREQLERQRVKARPDEVELPPHVAVRPHEAHRVPSAQVYPHGVPRQRHRVRQLRAGGARLDVRGLPGGLGALRAVVRHAGQRLVDDL